MDAPEAIAKIKEADPTAPANLTAQPYDQADYYGDATLLLQEPARYLVGMYTYNFDKDSA